MQPTREIGVLLNVVKCRDWVAVGCSEEWEHWVTTSQTSPVCHGFGGRNIGGQEDVGDFLRLVEDYYQSFWEDQQLADICDPNGHLAVW